MEAASELPCGNGARSPVGQPHPVSHTLRPPGAMGQVRDYAFKCLNGSLAPATRGARAGSRPARSSSKPSSPERSGRVRERKSMSHYAYAVLGMTRPVRLSKVSRTRPRFNTTETRSLAPAAGWGRCIAGPMSATQANTQSVPALWQLEISHYNEKVRWALDYKRIPHIRRSLLPGPHTVKAERLTGDTSTTPVLTVDGRSIGDSTRIIASIE